MKEHLETLLKKFVKYNSAEFADKFLKLSEDVYYDAVIISPGWTASKIFSKSEYSVQVVSQHTYTSVQLITMEEKKVAWIQCVPGSCNVIDYLGYCAGLNFGKLIFFGAAGGLTEEYTIGTVCTPSSCIAGSMAEAYLMENPLDWKPFQEIFPNNPEWIDSVCELADFSVKKAKVFCTDSIFCEYNHLDFITGFQTDLIEMETSGFYRMAELLEKPSIALLVVSDNSITGQPLFGMSQEQLADFNHSCQVLIPQIIERIVLQQKCNKVE